MTSDAGKEQKSLVVFYSRSGTTRKVAQLIAEELGADTEEIVDTKGRRGPIGLFSAGRDAARRKSTGIREPQKDPSGYDLVVVGTPVWAGTMTPAVRAYLEGQRERLPQVALFALARGKDGVKTLPQMAELLGKQPQATLALARGIGLGEKVLEKARQFARDLTPAP